MTETVAAESSQIEKHKSKHEVMFRAYAPNSTTPMLLSESIDAKVGDIVEKVRQHFGFEGSYVLQDEHDRVLTNNETLKQSGVKCGEDLFLTRKGGGVAAPLLSELHDEIDTLLFHAALRKVIGQFDSKTNRVKFEIVRKSDGQIFYLCFDIDGYPEMPPKVFFSDETFSRANHKPDYPAGGNTPFGASIFHGNGAICAPFNQLAYAGHSGLHGDWTLKNWRSMGAADQVKATTLSEMLSIVLRDLQHSKGRMA